MDASRIAYDHDMCKRRNEVDHLFRTLEGYRHIFSRLEKLDRIFQGLHQLRACCGWTEDVLTGP